jgi:hypothetical protein
VAEAAVVVVDAVRTALLLLLLVLVLVTLLPITPPFPSARTLLEVVTTAAVAAEAVSSKQSVYERRLRGLLPPLPLPLITDEIAEEVYDAEKGVDSPDVDF